MTSLVVVQGTMVPGEERALGLTGSAPAQNLIHHDGRRACPGPWHQCTVGVWRMGGFPREGLQPSRVSRAGAPKAAIWLSHARWYTREAIRHFGLSILVSTSFCCCLCASRLAPHGAGQDQLSWCFLPDCLLKDPKMPCAPCTAP